MVVCDVVTELVTEVVGVVVVVGLVVPVVVVVADVVTVIVCELVADEVADELAVVDRELVGVVLCELVTDVVGVVTVQSRKLPVIQASVIKFRLAATSLQFEPALKTLMLAKAHSSSAKFPKGPRNSVIAPLNTSAVMSHIAFDSATNAETPATVLHKILPTDESQADSTAFSTAAWAAQSWDWSTNIKLKLPEVHMKAPLKTVVV